MTSHEESSSCFRSAFKKVCTAQIVQLIKLLKEKKNAQRKNSVGSKVVEPKLDKLRPQRLKVFGSGSRMIRAVKN